MALDGPAAAPRQAVPRQAKKPAEEKGIVHGAEMADDVPGQGAEAGTLSERLSVVETY